MSALLANQDYSRKGLELDKDKQEKYVQNFVYSINSYNTRLDAYGKLVYIYTIIGTWHYWRFKGLFNGILE